MKNRIPVYTIILNRPSTPPPPVEPIPIDEVAKSAIKLESAKKITLGGDLTGAVLFDGSDDVTLKGSAKYSIRALKDANGNEISETYARKTELSKYAVKKDVTDKINYLETVLHATKEAVNKSITIDDIEVAANADISDMFGGN